MTYLNGDRRRANILRFVRDYSLQHGYGPTETAIRDHVGYRGHNLRIKHLDKLPQLCRDEHGRWMPVDDPPPTRARVQREDRQMDTAFKFDALEESRGCFWTSTHHGGIEHDALNSIAAALIALAEAQRVQYVQIGPIVFDPSDIIGVDIVDSAPDVVVHFRRNNTHFFHGKERAAFLRWWNEHASIERLDPDA